MRFRRAIVLANVGAAAFAAPQQPKPPRLPTVEDHAAHFAFAPATAAATVAARNDHVLATVPDLHDLSAPPQRLRPAATAASLAQLARPLARFEARRLAAVGAAVLHVAAAIGISALAGVGTSLVAFGLGVGGSAVLVSGLLVYMTTLQLVLYVLGEAFKPEARLLLPRLARIAAAHGLAFSVVDVSGRQHEDERTALLSSFRPIPLTAGTAPVA
jgi:hypothetical protein